MFRRKPERIQGTMDRKRVGNLEENDIIPKKKLLHEEEIRKDHWNLWGPYLPERQWGTVREDYSSCKDCWNYTTHDEAVGYSYKWGEDGLLGWCDKEAMLCTSLALWNGNDHILKERLFGLSGPQGNHGEDVKELYYYTDSDPQHIYNSALYKYPQSAFPYKQLITDNKHQEISKTEIEVLDTNVFDEGYWDVKIEYVKQSTTDTLCVCTVRNCGNKSDDLYIIPGIYFRNIWRRHGSYFKPSLKHIADLTVSANYSLGKYTVKFSAEKENNVEVLFTDNETSLLHCSKDDENQSTSEKYYKDAFHKYIIHGQKDAVNPNKTGTKSAAVYKVNVEAGGEKKIYWSLTCDNGQHDDSKKGLSLEDVNRLVSERKSEQDDFYSKILLDSWSEEERMISRLAFSGLLWSKQFYFYDVKTQQEEVRKKHSINKTTEVWNCGWEHLNNKDIISVPDKWEFPWYAPWDLAFQMIVFSRLDVEFSKNQLLLLLSDRYMNPNGQIPGCEFDLSATNPPLHAWACYRIYKNDGSRDKIFLETCFHALLKNYKWWCDNLHVGNYLYSGGFLGLDNISVIDRTASNLPTGYNLLQADGTGWMTFYCLTMMEVCLELCSVDISYQSQAEKFLDHFLNIAEEINKSASNTGLWDEKDKFFYDILVDGNNRKILKIRSLVGLVPVFACRVISLKSSSTSSLLTKLNKDSKYMRKISNDKYLLSLVDEQKLQLILNTVFNNEEFLSPFGICSLSKVYTVPYTIELGEKVHSVSYSAGESNTSMFGGNSNWRGPVWFPMNYLLVESLLVYNSAFPHLQFSYPEDRQTSILTRCSLTTIISDICRRVVSVFLEDEDGKRPVNGNREEYSRIKEWRNLVLFYEYFNADTGEGCGASHQTGWTSLVVEFLHILHMCKASDCQLIAHN